MKTELKHFTKDEPYGQIWEQVVIEYLKCGYKKDCGEYEFTVLNTVYKVLRRKETTVFYDAKGNALFDVSNERLKKEYEQIMGNDIPSDNVILADSASVKQKAKVKLENELAADSDNTFTKSIIGYLLKRCEEDEGLSQDVIQEHKTWKKCDNYIYEKARSQAKGKRGGVHIPDEIVYEWAEDYYHKDDKAEEEKKAKEEAERKAKEKKEAAQRKAKQKKEAADKKAKAKNDTVKTADFKQKKEDISEEQSKPKKSGKNMEGQLDLFSIDFLRNS